MVFYEDESNDESQPNSPAQSNDGSDNHDQEERAGGKSEPAAAKSDGKKVDEYDDEDNEGNYIERNRALFADQSLMKPNWLHFDYPVDLVWMIFCGCWNMGGNWSLASREDDKCDPVKWVGGCCFGCIFCGFIRNRVQTSIGVEPEGVGWGCLMHLCICCGPCSLVQEHRGILRWKKVTSKTFASKWKNSNRGAWDMAYYAAQGKMTGTKNGSVTM